MIMTMTYSFYINVADSTQSILTKRNAAIYLLTIATKCFISHTAAQILLLFFLQNML